MFKLINYANKLEVLSSTNTQITYRCPVCKGKLKLRIDTGAYSCFTSNCSPSDIRSKLGDKYNNYNKTKTHKYTPIVNPIDFTIKDDLATVDSCYQLSKVREFNDRFITHYIFNEQAKVERVDYKDERKKECYPKYKSGNNWIYGGNNVFGLYNDRYLNKNSTVLMAEGEKTADYISYYTNYLCLSPPTFGWTRNYLITQLIGLPITSIIYLPDNDTSGENKAQLVQKTSWSIYVPCTIFSYSENNIELNEGNDMVDLIIKKVDIKLLIKNYVRRIY